jgi:hypothetical protein
MGNKKLDVRCVRQQLNWEDKKASQLHIQTSWIVDLRIYRFGDTYSHVYRVIVSRSYHSNTPPKTKGEMSLYHTFKCIAPVISTHTSTVWLWVGVIIPPLHRRRKVRCHYITPSNVSLRWYQLTRLPCDCEWELSLHHYTVATSKGLCTSWRCTCPYVANAKVFVSYSS